MVRANLKDAEADETLRFVASTYDPARDRVIPGVGSRGARILDFAPLLVLEQFPLNNLIASSAGGSGERAGRKGRNRVRCHHGTAARRAARTFRLGFLQVRPMVVSYEVVEVTAPRISPTPAPSSLPTWSWATASQNDIQDIVFVRPENFSPMQTPADRATNWRRINRELAEQHRPYLSDWIWPLGQFASFARHSGGLEPDFRSARRLWKLRCRT